MFSGFLKKKIGREGEDKACKFLKKKGYKIVERNWRFHKNEIDIIAVDKEEIVFIEVKKRKNLNYGYPEEAVDYHKRKSIIKAARAFVMKKGIENFRGRFDIVSIEGNKIRHIKDAFSLDE